MEENRMQKPHKVLLANRQEANFSGIVDVISFDVNEVILETEQGTLHIKGNNLHVNRLSLEQGEVDLSGEVDSMTYSDSGHKGGKEESFWKKVLG